MEVTFNGRRALVTGAASGFGRAIAKRLAECGAEVIALDVKADELESLKEEVPKIKIITVDLCNWDDTKAVIQSAGPVDLLVNNAGVSQIIPLTEVLEKDYEDVFNVNIKAVINVTQTVIENLLKRKSPGSIVNISSIASKAGLPVHPLYCATKAAVDGFTRAVALDYGPQKIRINSVNPTVVLTELGKRVWADPKLAGAMLDKTPLKRFGEIHEIVDAVVFLLSDKASMITGICMPVDGGFLAC